MSKEVTVIVNAKFPQMKPAHHAHISKQGTGSSLERATVDAVRNLYHDARLKGKRQTNLIPFALTVTTVEKVSEEDE